jgi:hypothetical protein
MSAFSIPTPTARSNLASLSTLPHRLVATFTTASSPAHACGKYEVIVNSKPVIYYRCICGRGGYCQSQYEANSHADKEYTRPRMQSRDAYMSQMTPTCRFGSDVAFAVSPRYNSTTAVIGAETLFPAKFPDATGATCTHTKDTQGRWTTKTNDKLTITVRQWYDNFITTMLNKQPSNWNTISTHISFQMEVPHSLNPLRAAITSHLSRSKHPSLALLLQSDLKRHASEYHKIQHTLPFSISIDPPSPGVITYGKTASIYTRLVMPLFCFGTHIRLYSWPGNKVNTTTINDIIRQSATTRQPPDNQTTWCTSQQQHLDNLSYATCAYELDNGMFAIIPAGMAYLAQTCVDSPGRVKAHDTTARPTATLTSEFLFCGNTNSRHHPETTWRELRYNVNEMRTFNRGSNQSLIDTLVWCLHNKESCNEYDKQLKHATDIIFVQIQHKEELAASVCDELGIQEDEKYKPDNDNISTTCDTCKSFIINTYIRNTQTNHIACTSCIIDKKATNDTDVTLLKLGHLRPSQMSTSDMECSPPSI